MRQKSFPTRWVPLLLLTRSYPQRREVHAKKYLNNHKIKKKMKRKLRRDGSEIHTRQILLVLFREYAAKIQVFRYLNCFSPLNLTTSSSPQRFFTRDVKSLFICIGARNPKVWRSIPHGDSEFSLCPTLWQDKKKTPFSISLPSSKLIISLISTYKHYAIDIADPSSMQDACHMNCLIDLAHRGVSVAQWL